MLCIYVMLCIYLMLCIYIQTNVLVHHRCRCIAHDPQPPCPAAPLASGAVPDNQNSPQSPPVSCLQHPQPYSHAAWLEGPFSAAVAFMLDTNMTIREKILVRVRCNKSGRLSTENQPSGDRLSSIENCEVSKLSLGPSLVPDWWSNSKRKSIASAPNTASQASVFHLLGQSQTIGDDSSKARSKGVWSRLARTDRSDIADWVRVGREAGIQPLLPPSRAPPLFTNTEGYVMCRVHQSRSTHTVPCCSTPPPEWW